VKILTEEQQRYADARTLLRKEIEEECQASFEMGRGERDRLELAKWVLENEIYFTTTAPREKALAIIAMELEG
jgi:hypothetical protein